MPAPALRPALGAALLFPLLLAALPAAAEQAPVIAPDCVTPTITQGERGWRTVTFTNGCGVPVRVRFAVSRSGPMQDVSAVLRPGETSRVAPLNAWLDSVRFQVCSYATVPEWYRCGL